MTCVCARPLVVFEECQACGKPFVFPVKTCNNPACEAFIEPFCESCKDRLCHESSHDAYDEVYT